MAATTPRSRAGIHPTERRIIQMLLKLVFEDYKDAWAPVMDVGFEYLDSEVNPAMANIVSPTEVIVVSSFHIELDGGGGDFHVAMPPTPCWNPSANCWMRGCRATRGYRRALEQGPARRDHGRQGGAQGQAAGDRALLA